MYVDLNGGLDRVHQHGTPNQVNAVRTLMESGWRLVRLSDTKSEVEVGTSTTVALMSHGDAQCLVMANGDVVPLSRL